MRPETLGHYRLESQLGAGGMGVVYEATDTRLDRRVAIKVLHEEMLKGPDAIVRFEREGRLLASLSHPNIASIHGLEQADGITFLVLEYVPGETLAERLARGPLPVPEALRMARQIAEALEAAHAKGIVHRDLKPANIKITADGQVKVLDFGLAKALDTHSGVSAGSPTVAAVALTQTGIVMGTVGYMSPEQASGSAVDQRTDLWAFGCVLYEMLAGRPAFAGNSPTDVLAGVLSREPDWTALPADTPENARRVIRRCLMKVPGSRLHHAADARVELEDVADSAVPGSVVTRPRRRAVFGVVAGAALLVAAGATALWLIGSDVPAAEPRVVRFSFDLPQGSRIAPSWGGVNLTFSADSKSLIYPASQPPVVLHIRRLDESAGTVLEPAKGMNNPLMSPDGRWLALTDYPHNSLVKVPLSGGAPEIVAPVEMAFHGQWGSDGYIYWSNRLTSGIVRSPENGGETEPVTTVDAAAGERNHRFARLLPGGGAVMFTVATRDVDSYDDARIDILELGSRKRRTLVKGGTYPRYSPSGHIVYARGGSLYAVPFDQRKLDVVGPPVKVLDGVLMSTTIGTAYFDISATGDLAYAMGPPESGQRALYWVDRHGQEIARLPLPPRPYLNPRISPDGRYLALEVEGPNHDLYLYDFEREITSRVSNDGISHGPIWTPDGKRIAYRTWQAGGMTVAWMPADRSAPGEPLTSRPAWQSAASFSVDGQNLLYDETDRSRMGFSSIWVLPVAGNRTPRQFTPSGGAAKFSPDGRWVAYCSNESGRPEIYVQPWPGPGAKTQLSSEGGIDPIWSRDGKEIFYRNGTKMMAVAVSTQPTFTAAKPRLLWTGEYMLGLSSSCGIKGVTVTSYDVSRDGERFLMIKDNDQQMFATRIMVVVNWAQELKRIAERSP